MWLVLPLFSRSWRQRHGPLLAQWVYNDLLREITLELCFEVHRKKETQNGHLITPEALSNRSQDIYAPFQSKKANPADSLVSCDNCDKRIHVSKYAPHLEKCLGLGGRNRSKRKSSSGQSSDLDFAATLAESQRLAESQQQTTAAAPAASPHHGAHAGTGSSNPHAPNGSG